MSKRLEDIKNRYMELEYDFNLRKEDIDWLIKRIELLGKLREEDTTYYNELLTKVREQNKRYREALEFYANKENYYAQHDSRTQEIIGSHISFDEGDIARKALESDNE